jgi:hypothetical protein
MGQDELVSHCVSYKAMIGLCRWIFKSQINKAILEEPEELIGSFSHELNKMLRYVRGSGKRLAEHLKITEARLSHWRKGDSLPSTEYLVLICRYFEWPISKYLFLVNCERAARYHYRYLLAEKNGALINERNPL